MRSVWTSSGLSISALPQGWIALEERRTCFSRLPMRRRLCAVWSSLRVVETGRRSSRRQRHRKQGGAHVIPAGLPSSRPPIRQQRRADHRTCQSGLCAGDDFRHSRLRLLGAARPRGHLRACRALGRCGGIHRGSVMDRQSPSLPPSSAFKMTRICAAPSGFAACRCPHPASDRAGSGRGALGGIRLCSRVTMGLRSVAWSVIHAGKT